MNREELNLLNAVAWTLTTCGQAVYRGESLEPLDSSALFELFKDEHGYEPPPALPEACEKMDELTFRGDVLNNVHDLAMISSGDGDSTGTVARSVLSYFRLHSEIQSRLEDESEEEGDERIERCKNNEETGMTKSIWDVMDRGSSLGFTPVEFVLPPPKETPAPMSNKGILLTGLMEQRKLLLDRIDHFPPLMNSTTYAEKTQELKSQLTSIDCMIREITDSFRNMETDS